MGLSPGTKLGGFEIVTLLGVGGMGEVYRARDTKLGREVAIKVLPEALAQHPERRARFEREAKTLASLTHAHIATLYEFQHVDDIHFLVMELVEGDTLADRIKKSPLTVNEALRAFTQIAEALEAAHGRNVVHRDLKPANIKFGSDGRIKVLDFGLAKSFEPVRTTSPEATTLLAEDAPTKVTTDGAILGTPTYMSPEQARGQEVDKRTDVWAFGCCLYEALTGESPFKGDTASDTLVSVLERDADWSLLPRDVPPQVTSLLRRCLEKETHRRPSGMGDIAMTLEDVAKASVQASPVRVPVYLWAVTAAIAVAALVAVFWFGRVRQVDAPALPLPARDRPEITSLVVLPFDNLMGDPEQEYFVDGMTDALSAELGKIKALKVISRNSAMRYKGTDKPLSQIADELGVEGLIEGSILRSGGKVRITAQLIDAATDAHLWAESYTGTLENILELQGEVAMDIAEAIRIVVTPAEETRITSAKPVDPLAYEAYLRATFFLWKFTPDSLEKAVESFLRAVELDPGFAEAHAWLGIAYWLPSAWGIFPPVEAVTRARPAIDKALALDDTLATAHAGTAWIALVFDWDWTRAEREFLRAIELNPGLPEGYDALAWYYASLGRFDDAMREQQEAIDLDPLNLLYRDNLADVYSWAGRHEEAIARYQKVLELDPAYLLSLRSAAADYIVLSRYDEAVEVLERGMAIHGPLHGMLGRLVWAYAGAGRKAEAEAVLAELHARDREEYVKATTFALAYAALGDMDEAFRWIDQALEDRNFLLSQPYEPVWHLLRGDPRFLDMLRRINYPAISDFEAAL